MNLHRFRVLIAAAAAALQALPATAPTAFSAERYLAHVKQLASDEYKGRATGSPEFEKAAEYLIRQYHALGLQPVDGRSFKQAFSVTTNAKLGKSNRLSLHDRSGEQILKPQQDFVPFNFSSRGEISGTVVFAGYGITAKEYNYDDYEGIDAKGKIVLMLRHEPQEFDEKSVFAGKVYTDHAQFARKASNAKFHGARAVILIGDRANHRGEPDDLEKFGSTAGPMDAGIPFVQMKAEFAERWLADAGRSLESIQAAIDKDLKPQAFPLAETVKLKGQTDVERSVKTVHNVAAFLPGQTDEYLIIGAHYDHLGMGEQFSMAPSEAGKAIHYGADDNASGTAGVLELARYFSGQPKQKRGILFLHFAGEELGLLGSSFYVDHPKFPLEKAAAMINMDMIGRIRDKKVYVGGVGTGQGIRTIVEEAGARYPFQLDLSETVGYGSSDHTSFTIKQVPVLFFFSGLHGDYHKPSDTWDKIDSENAVKLLEMIGDIGTRVSSAQEKPMFVRVAEPKNAHASAGTATASSGSGSNSGYGPYFGSIPDFAEPPTGVRFADVKDDSPAATAGLRRGDIMVQFDGKPVGNLYDFTYLLRTKKPGDEVVVKVLRDNNPVEVKVVLTKRK